MNAGNINPWAVLVAAVSTFVIGGLWYSPLLFGRAWMAANGFTPEQVARFSKPRAFGGSFLFALVMAASLALFLVDTKTDWRLGLTTGLLAGAGWVASALAIVGLFENRSWRHIFVNAGYQVVAFGVMGLILGAWR